MKQVKPNEKYQGVLKKRYAKATKKERSLMLDEFVKTTGYHRKHAAAILSERFVRTARPIRRVRAATYTAADHRAVWQITEWLDQIGSKRLRAAMDVELPRLRASGHLRVNEETYQQTLRDPKTPCQRVLDSPTSTKPSNASSTSDTPNSPRSP